MPIIRRKVRKGRKSIHFIDQGNAKGEELHILPNEIWKHIYDYLPKEDKPVFGRVCNGAYALDRKFNNQTFFHHSTRERRIKVSDIFHYIIKEGNFAEAEKLILQDPTLLLEEGHMADCKLAATPISLPCVRRIFRGTIFECMLQSLDVEMCELLAKCFSLLQNGDKEKAKQIKKIFPKGLEKHFKKQKPCDLVEVLADTITNSSTEEIQAALNNIKYNNSVLCMRLEQFRHQFAKLACEEKVFNPQHLCKAVAIYNEQYAKWDSHRRDLFWRQIIGYIQRFTPLWFKQALRQGIYDLVGANPPKLNRVKTVTSCIKDQDMSLVELDDNPNRILGLDVAFQSTYADWGNCTGYTFCGMKDAISYIYLTKYVEKIQQVCRKIYDTSLNISPSYPVASL